MCRHVVRSLIIMRIKRRIFGRDPGEEGLEIVPGGVDPPVADMLRAAWAITAGAAAVAAAMVDLISSAADHGGWISVLRLRAR